MVGRAGEINHSNKEETSGRDGAARRRGTNSVELRVFRTKTSCEVKTPTLHKAVVLQEVTVGDVSASVTGRLNSYTDTASLINTVYYKLLFYRNFHHFNLFAFTRIFRRAPTMPI